MYRVIFRTAVVALVFMVIGLIGSCDNPSSSDTKTPTIVSVVPANGSSNVSADTTHLYVTFDRPMDENWSLAWNMNSLLPTNELVNWETNSTVFVLAVATDDDGLLFPGATYRWMLNPSWFDHEYRFGSVDGTPLLEDYEIEFTATGTADTSDPAIESVTLLCGDPLVECAEKSASPWALSIDRFDLRIVRIEFDKPMQATGWSYNFDSDLRASNSWTDRSTFEMEIENSPVPSGSWDYLLNPSTHESRSFHSVWGRYLPETSVTITVNAAE